MIRSPGTTLSRLRGFDRVVDWDGDLDATVDIGAMELAISEMYG